ncbi:hypothetical protein NAV33_07225 [Pseudomonas stutzeri]|uniref:hypothetical protein n=1 Tax=Stutzerimonas stutzeri TaxID=316 RepID=UPI00210CBE2A|nr:hypothetical protein [Stutzerimonas stutzeri]MCQ4311685.1 hypothetical protein [Stutzerimonas stutzeri]
MAIPRVTLNGVSIAAAAGSPVHNYSPLGGASTVRMHGGAGVKVKHWRKTLISISGSGSLNPGIDHLDYDSVMTLHCSSPMAASSVGTETVIEMRGKARPDFAPWGLYRIGTGWRKTSCTVTDGFAHLTPVEGAEQYQVLWYPTYQVFAEPPQHSRDASTGAVGWSFVAEEA